MSLGPSFDDLVSFHDLEKIGGFHDILEYHQVVTFFSLLPHRVGRESNGGDALLMGDSLADFLQRDECARLCDVGTDEVLILEPEVIKCGGVGEIQSGFEITRA